jgi:hypothetical protein
MRYAPQDAPAPEPVKPPRRGVVPAFLRPGRATADQATDRTADRTAGRTSARAGAGTGAPDRSRPRDAAGRPANSRTRQARSRRTDRPGTPAEKPARGLLKVRRRDTDDTGTPPGRGGLLGRAPGPRGPEPAAPAPPGRPDPGSTFSVRPEWTAIDVAMLLPAALVVWFGAILLRSCAAEASGAAALCLWIMVAFWVTLLTARRPTLRMLRWGWVVAGLVAAASLPGG